MTSKSADPMRGGDGALGATETTPLLNAPASALTSLEQDGNDDGTPKTVFTEYQAQPDPSGEEEAEKPMPYGQILLLCYASLVEPIAYFSIFPFVNEMIFRTGGIPESDVGFRSGLIESLFSLVQMLLMIIYGRAADRLGRKPVLVFSLAGVSIATALFGMSQTLWQMIATRCLAGVFAGSSVTIRTMISENCTKDSQARAFSWYMFTRNLGIFIGPLIGGVLANPSDQFPSVFKGQFFKDYPYALATYTAGTVCLTAALVSLLFLKETLTRKTVGQADSEPSMSTWEVLRSPGVPNVLYIFGHTMLLALAYTAVSPVCQYTSISSGGWSFSDPAIAGFLAIAGASQSLWILLAFPPLHKRFGTGSILRVCALVWPLLMALYPVANELLRHEMTLTFWIFTPIGLVLASGVSMAFACVQLCINDVSPSSTVLGTVNALALTVNSGVRAFAPIAFTSLFAVGVKIEWADGHLVWVVLIAIAAGLAVAVHLALPEQAEGKPKKTAANPDQADVIR